MASVKMTNMRNCFSNLNKIEFVVTYACTGRCKHCSEGDHNLCGEMIDPAIAKDSVIKIAREYDIQTVMAFGGEPLLHTEAVYSIISAAKEMGVPRRQVITNGYFTKDIARMREVAKSLYECGVNDLLLSVDAFHQETIPLDAVKSFAEEVKACGMPIRLQPAWLVSPTDRNEYNDKTREILDSFCDTGIDIGDGNVVFPEGNALQYLAEYFVGKKPENPYTEDPCDVKCISFEPNGDVLGSNVYREGIMKIIKGYTP